MYRNLRDSGYEVFAVNPKAESVEGDRAYPDLKSVPGRVDGVVVATPPDAARQLVEQCAELGIPRVWMHRSFGEGSVSDEAVRFCREHQISVIPGGCPMMFREPVDFGHKCMRWVLGLTGGLPK
jgi:predicted CoA-binding protein